MKNLMGFDVDDALEFVGLRRRNAAIQFILPAVGFLALGAAVGAGVGLMFAPSSGRRLRQEVGDKLDQLRERMKNEVQQKNHAINTHAVAQQS
jgi:YtxH-like protein